MTLLLTVSSGTTDATATFSSVEHFGAIDSAAFTLVTTPGSTANESSTLNVYVQATVDGTNYNDFVSFTQVASTGGASNKQQASWVRGVTPTSPVGTLDDAALAAGTVQQGPVGHTWRAKYTIGTSTGPMSFSLYIDEQRKR